MQNQNRTAVPPLSESAVSSGVNDGTLALQDVSKAFQRILKLQSY